MADLAATLAGTERYDRAWEVSRDISSGEEQAWALVSVAEALAKAGDIQRGQALLEEALEAVHTTSFVVRREEVLLAIAEVFAVAAGHRHKRGPMTTS